MNDIISKHLDPLLAFKKKKETAEKEMAIEMSRYKKTKQDLQELEEKHRGKKKVIDTIESLYGYIQSTGSLMSIFDTVHLGNSLIHIGIPPKLLEEDLKRYGNLQNCLNGLTNEISKKTEEKKILENQMQCIVEGKDSIFSTSIPKCIWFTAKKY